MPLFLDEDVYLHIWSYIKLLSLMCVLISLIGKVFYG